MNEEWRNEIVTKGAAADAARDVYKRNTTAAISAMMAIKGLPSAQPEQAIKDCRNCKFGDYNDHWNINFCYYSGDCNNWDKWEPSAQPQRMKGKWIHDGYDIPHGVDWTHCSVCGRREPYVPAAMTNFCPSCGAWMRGDEDAAD